MSWSNCASCHWTSRLSYLVSLHISRLLLQLTMSTTLCAPFRSISIPFIGTRYGGKATCTHPCCTLAIADATILRPKPHDASSLFPLTSPSLSEDASLMSTILGQRQRRTMAGAEIIDRQRICVHECRWMMQWNRIESAALSLFLTFTLLHHHA